MNSKLAVVPDDTERPLGELQPCNGVIVLSGYGIKVTVESGHLSIEDGIGAQRRRGRFSRALAGFNRLVIIGHSGIVTLEALRWLNDIGASIVQIDSDGNVILAGGPSGLDDARLRRAQALAITNGVGLEIAKDLIRQKLAGQADVLYADFENSGRFVTDIRLIRRKMEGAVSVEELRHMEAQAAGIYWNAWSKLPIRFAKKEAERIPNHWLEFGSRSSPISKPSPRRAGNPANALLNYLYAIVEAECRIAALAVGLDPAIGVMHSDLRARDSLACDLMEPVRPKADTLVLEILKRREFRKADFFETREGVCRLLPSITTELVEKSAQFRKAIGSVAENVAERIFRSVRMSKPNPSENALDVSGTKQRETVLPTPITQSNRTNGIERQPSKFKAPTPERKSWRLDCLRCGKEIDGKHRSYCNTCLSPL